MNSKVEKIANAVLYEGYMLYPYRRSAIKNRQRWNFGVVYPQAHSEMQKGVDSCFQQTECLIRGNEVTSVDIRVRFLQAFWRQEATSNAPAPKICADFEPSGDIFDLSAAEQSLLLPLQESSSQTAQLHSVRAQGTIEREIGLISIPLADLLRTSVRHHFAFTDCGASDTPPTNMESNRAAAPRQAISGIVDVHATKCVSGAFGLSISISNATPMESVPVDRENLLLRCFLSAHTILHVSGGEFVSLTDPPSDLRDAAAACRNVGTWPVLVGDEGSHDQMLSSPIILYDYPQIAPESPGDLFDSTEIDEILALRILTLSDDEKREIRQSDDRAREILDRTEMLPAEHFAKLHGVLRGMKPVIGADDESQPKGAQ